MFLWLSHSILDITMILNPQISFCLRGSSNFLILGLLLLDLSRGQNSLLLRLLAQYPMVHILFLPLAFFLDMTNALSDYIAGPPSPNIYTTTDQTLEGFQKFDLWSLGCVLSEAATWVILGYPGIKTFSTLRRQSLDKLCSEDNNGEPEAQPNTNVNIPRRGDYFHDGSTVLAIVTSWHAFLRSSVRRSDMITTKVLDIIDRGLLVSDITKRFDAHTLYIQLELAISEGKKEGCLLPSIDIDIEECLREEWSKDAEEDVSGEYD
jgi:hypothetical protein